MDGRGRQGGASDLRAAAVEALAQLIDPSLGQTFLGLLAAGEAPRTRRAALLGLRNLADPRTADAVIRWLAQERDEGVRLAAIDALEKVASFGVFVARLGDYTDPALERDPSVRDRAWLAFVRLLPTASDQELNEWRNRLSRDADHRLPVLTEMASRNEKAGRADDLAARWEDIGDAYMKLAKPAPDQAAAFFRKALDYWLAHNGQGW